MLNDDINLEINGFSISQSITKDEKETFCVEILIPLAQQLRSISSCELFYFTYNPLERLILRVLGQNKNWERKKALNQALCAWQTWRKEEKVSENETEHYNRETNRYGGQIGAALAEKIFFLDSCFCLDYWQLLRAKTESFEPPIMHVLVADQLLKRLGFSRETRADFFAEDKDKLLAAGPKAEDILTRDSQKIQDLVSPYFSSTTPSEIVWRTAEAATSIGHYLEQITPLVEHALNKQKQGHIALGAKTLMEKFIHARGIRLGIPYVSESFLFEAWSRVLRRQGT